VLGFRCGQQFPGPVEHLPPAGFGDLAGERLDDVRLGDLTMDERVENSVATCWKTPPGRPDRVIEPYRMSENPRGEYVRRQESYDGLAQVSFGDLETHVLDTLCRVRPATT
jgi:hypothetical protein